MKKLILLFLFALMYSCETKSQTINIPNKVEMTNLENKTVVKGTRVLIDKSENYSYYNELKRFQKDNNNFFQIIEYLNQDCDAVIEKTSRKIDELESKGGKVRVKKKFKL